MQSTRRQADTYHDPSAAGPGPRVIPAAAAAGLAGSETNNTEGDPDSLSPTSRPVSGGGDGGGSCCCYCCSCYPAGDANNSSIGGRPPCPAQLSQSPSTATFPATPAMTTSSRSSLCSVDDPAGKGVPLSIWDQTSLRSYMRIALCFPFDDRRRPEAAAHIRLSLDRLAGQRPEFAGALDVGCLGAREGLVLLRTSPKDQIPAEVVDLSDDFAYASYDDLRRAEFPPAAFVHERFAMPSMPTEEGGRTIPVSTIKAFFIRGGLLLSIFLHHSIADGDCLRMFVESLAAQSRDDPIDVPSDLMLQTGLLSPSPSPSPSSLPSSSSTSLSAAAAALAVEDLARAVPEYALLPEPTGPTTPHARPDGVPASDIRKIGKTFVFRNDRLNELRARLQVLLGAAKPPSNYISLAALTWVHASRARLADDAEYVPRGLPSQPAKLQTMVNWKTRTVRPAASGNYFGNATAIAVTRTPTADLLATDDGGHDGLCGLASIVGAIQRTIRGVDDAWIDKRTAFFAAVPDPRYVGIDFDPRTPQDLGFNTWKYFGADTRWDIPGIRAPSPDAIRRIQDAWNMSGALILPAKADSQVHELLVTLPRTSMEVLCRDEGWMQWVERVIG